MILSSSDVGTWGYGIEIEADKIKFIFKIIAGSFNPILTLYLKHHNPLVGLIVLNPSNRLWWGGNKQLKRGV